MQIGSQQLKGTLKCCAFLNKQGQGVKVLTKRQRLATRSARPYTSHPVTAFLEEETMGTNRAPSTATVTLPKPRPGDLDKQRFKLHWSVALWEDFDPKTWTATLNDDSLPAASRLRAFSDTLSSLVSRAGILNDPQAAAYWAYHLLRSGFFLSQGVVGLLAARASASQTTKESGLFSKLETLARAGWQTPVAEALLMYYQDLESIREKKYGLPWDMATPNRQFNPLFVFSRGVQFVREAAITLERRNRGAADPIWLKSAALPDYFQNTFHYQTDGWMSQASAKVYEVSTETLFLGRQDAMQRATLVPISDYMAGKDPSQVQALEVACGTGRFATFVKDLYPTLDLTVSDLSPYYLAEARDNIKYWKSVRAPATVLPGPDGTGTKFLQTPAEAIAAPDASFDIVYSIYLFHELPADVRAQAAKEMARVLKPGGLLVLTDSMQRGDRSVYEDTMGNFGDFNEPYFRNYIETDLGALFVEAGLECDAKVMASSSKALSFRKPVVMDGGEAEGLAPDMKPLGDPSLN